MNGESRYKIFIETCLREVKRVLKPYSGKFSKKTYTQHQHAVSILLMKYENKPYRDVTYFLKELWSYFDFHDDIPHFTTLQKFFNRVPTYVWDFLLEKTYELFAGSVANIAIDSTGYKLHHASQHYEHRVGIQYRRKRYMKHFISVDTERQAIIASEDWRSYVNDTTRFKPILRKTRKRTRIGDATADKGFDSEENHRYAREEVGAKSIIPLRWDVLVENTKGKYRKKLRRYFPKKRYNRRVIVETINSVEKRKFGAELRSKLLRTQRREMKVVDVVYNIHRYMGYCASVFIGFLQSRFFFTMQITGSPSSSLISSASTIFRPARVAP
jgi:hypothetical protein